jgi:hypothetical protein
MFAALTAAAIMLRTIADTFAPPDPGPAGYQLRSAMSTYSAIGTFLLAGLSAGYRTGRSVAGLLTAATAAAAGHALALCGDVVLFVAVIQHDPVKLGVFYQTGGWGEVFAFLIIMPVVAAVLGWLGGACGKVLTPSSSVSHVGM